MNDAKSTSEARADTEAGSKRAPETPRWGMVIDVNRCVGCQTCTIACKNWNATPPDVQWRRVLDVEAGTFPDVQRQFLVVGCQHCAEPPCVPVCPTGATRQRADGLVTMNYDVCIGCAYCAVSCPYQARTIVHDQQWYYGEETVQEKAVAHGERIGVAQKCTFCQDRVDDGISKGLTPGVDPLATPACSAACIAQAIQFGDFNDPDSTVSRLTSENSHFRMHEALGTDPQIKYLYTTPAVPGRDPLPTDADDERMADPANPLTGQLQKFWDWRAAMNWCFGGVGSGFAVVSWLFHLAGSAERPLSYANVGAAVLMAIGLFFVFLKIGRKFRFWRATSRPHTSWMTRELYAVAVFYPAVLAGLVWPHEAILAVAALSALAFLWCQAKILHMAKGIPNWRAPLIPWMILATGLFEGFGLFSVVTLNVWFWRWGTNLRDLNAGEILALLLILLFFVTANAVLWTAYRRTARERGIGPLSRKTIERASWPLHIGGHAAPVVLAIAAWLLPEFDVLLLTLAGLLIIAGGFYWKFTVIVRAGYQQGFAMPKMPRRGSGERAAPARMGVSETAASAAAPH